MSRIIIKEIMLTCVNIQLNENKFYHIRLFNNNEVLAEYGRIKDKNSVRLDEKGPIGEAGFIKLMNSKLKGKGKSKYEISNILLDNNNLSNIKSNFNLLDLAMSQIETNNEKCKDLVKNLVDKNIHNIAAISNISFSKNSGSFVTPLGPVTKEGIFKAIMKLDQLHNIIHESDKIDIDNRLLKLNQEYFLIIPTDIKNLRQTENYLIFNKERLNMQYDLCETLLKTIDLLITEIPSQSNKESIFKVKMNLLIDKNEIKRITNLFEKSKNKLHGNTVNSLKINNIYNISLNDEEKLFRKDMSNIMELFHGTKVINILSILKSGLLMPSQTPGRKTGAMYGNGLYFSDQSTKSLNYCDGMHWNNSAKQDKVYLFIADVAMGNYNIPTHSTKKPPPKNFDSYFAKANNSGVRNNEMIVFNKNQIKLKYIIEMNAN